MTSNLKALLERHRQFLTYSLLGISGVVIDFVLFVVLYNFFGIDALIANIFSTSCGIINNFILNRHYTFNMKDFTLVRFLAFYATGVTGILASTAIIRIFHDYGGLDANIVKFLSIIVVVILQYSLNKTISFQPIITSHTSSLRLIGNFIKTHRLSILVLLVVIANFVFFIPKDLLGVDESDNFLSSQLILAGQLPYVDFFSHHMPGAYFISTLFYLLANGDPLVFRIIAMLSVLAWLVVNFWLIRRYGNSASANWYLLLTGLAHGLLLQHMWLAETYILLAITTVIIMLLAAPLDRIRSTAWLFIFSILLCSVTLMAVSYVYAVALLYVLLAVKLGLPRSPKELLKLASVITAPYFLFAAYLLSTDSFDAFIFQNLTFNAQYYAPFFGDIGSNPAVAGINIVWTSLGQIGTILRNIPGHLMPLALLLCYLSLPLAVWLKKRRAEAMILALLLLVVNARVGLFGAPGISSSYIESVSQHAELYRGLALLFGALALAIIPIRNYKKALVRRSPQDISSIMILILLVVNFIAIVSANASIYVINKQGFSEMIANYEKLPEEKIRIINHVADGSDTVWIGPLDFLGQTYLQAERATEYTFFLPWHYDCPSCKEEFYSQLSQAKPLVIAWQQATASYKKTDINYDRDMLQFLEGSYHQITSHKSGFESLYFRNDARDTIMQRLEKAGYEPSR